jgi:hypothetical protein
LTNYSLATPLTGTPWGKAISQQPLAKATAPTAQAREKDDVEALLQLEKDMAQAWVQRDAQTLERILADDYTLGGTGDSLIKKEEYVAGLDNPEFRNHFCDR